MPILIDVLVVIAALVVVTDGLRRIVEQFDGSTPLLISVGVVLVTAGAGGFFLNPLLCGSLLIAGRALHLLGDMRRMRG